MSKFQLTKRFDLGFLGTAWEDAKCYLEFYPLTVKDLKTNLNKFTKVKQDDPKSVSEGIDDSLTLLKDRFIKGTGIGENGETVLISKDDLIDLPAEVLTEVLGFLSSSLTSKKEMQ